MLGAIAWSGFSFAFGLFNVAAMVATAALRDGAYTKNRKPTEEEERELVSARKKYWNLSGNPLRGFKHDFFTLKNGVKLHYVVNNSLDDEPKDTNVAIFIHGFPDSYLLWKRLLESPDLAGYTLIAVDLPGYGGSDSLSKYGPDGILEAVAGFVLGMREQYLSEGRKLVLVTHDWGGIVGARLAAEAKELADHFIIASAAIPSLTYSNTRTRLASSKQMLHTWLRWPFNLRLFKKSFAPLIPVLSQIGRSFYIFMLNLPSPVANWFVRTGNFWFLRTIHRVQAGLLRPDGKFTRDLSHKEMAEWQVFSGGPSLAQFEQHREEKLDGYSDSVRKRIDDYGMSEKIRFYRDSLFLGVWEKSLEIVVALSEIPSTSRSGSGAGLFEDGPPGALKAPATIIAGRHDLGFDHTLGLNGVTDYLAKGSQVLMVERSGHWLPFEPLGAKVIEDCVEWALEDGNEKLQERFQGFDDVLFLVQK